MEREELQRLLRQRPFQPFRLLLLDGRTFEIRYPEMNLLAPSYIKVGVPEPGTANPICDHTEFVRLSQIARAELLPASTNSMPS